MGKDVTDLDLTPPGDRVVQTRHNGRDVVIVLRGQVYDCYVDGVYFDTHSPRGGFDPWPSAEQLRGEGEVAMALEAVKVWLVNEDQLRVNFPFGQSVRSRPSGRHPGKYIVGTVVGHRHRQVLVKVVESTYRDPSNRFGNVGDVVALSPMQLQQPELYPEHAKAAKIQDLTQVAGQFLDWLLGPDTPYALAQYDPASDQLHHLAHVDPQKLLAQWQGIDLDVLEQEKQEMLARMRALSPEA